MTSTFPHRLYLVISQQDCGDRDFLKVTEKAILGGVDLIQLREKNCTQKEFLYRAKSLKEVTNTYGVPLIINDNLSVAKAVEADGIHVGLNDLPPIRIRQDWSPKKLIGYSIEYLDQLGKKDALQSDYLGISPVFKTPTKTNTVTEWRLEGIRKIRELTDKPLIAIGKMNRHNARAVMQSGADCIAVVSAICSAQNPEKAAYELKNEILKSTR